MKINPLLEKLRSSKSYKQNKLKMDIIDIFVECCPFYLNGNCFNPFDKKEIIENCKEDCNHLKIFRQKIEKLINK